MIAAGLGATLGWITRTCLWKRKLRRKQAFFGLPDHSESLLVVNRDAGSPDLAVHRFDVFASEERPVGHPLCIEHNPTGAQLTFSSPTADPSYLPVPLREQ